MSYYEFYLAPVKESNKGAFVEQSSFMNSLFKEYGAEEIKDFWSISIPEGKLTSFGLALKLESDESVVLGYIGWRSKEARDKAWESLMQDDRMHSSHMPFDGKRLISGSFEKLAEL